MKGKLHGKPPQQNGDTPPRKKILQTLMLLPSGKRLILFPIVEQTRKLIANFDGKFFAKCNSCSDDHLRNDLTRAVFVIKQHGIQEGKKLLDEVVKKSDDGQNSALKRYLDLVKAGLFNQAPES